MMYAKLALRNVKRSAKDYLIYVITLILSVGLFYGFMSIASPYYNESLPVKINLEILNKAMRIAVPIVALLVVFLISYVNTYMLRRKQKEFAVQTIIGMEQRTVAFIFFVETMSNCSCYRRNSDNHLGRISSCSPYRFTAGRRCKKYFDYTK